jgi:hypothetical protein
MKTLSSIVLTSDFRVYGSAVKGCWVEGNINRENTADEYYLTLNGIRIYDLGYLRQKTLHALRRSSIVIGYIEFWLQ